MAALGPYYPGSTATVDNEITGTFSYLVEWQNHANIKNSSSSSVALAEIRDGALGTSDDRSPSDYLRAYNFGFADPGSSPTITGILVEIFRKQQSSSNSTADQHVRLADGVTFLGTDKASASIFPTSLEVASYGGDGDTWGRSWTWAEIANLGVYYAVQNPDSFSLDDVSVAWIRVTIFFEANEIDATLLDGAPTLSADANLINSLDVTLLDDAPILSADVAETPTLDVDVTLLDGAPSLLASVSLPPDRTINATLLDGAPSLSADVEPLRTIISATMLDAAPTLSADVDVDVVLDATLVDSAPTLSGSLSFPPLTAPTNFYGVRSSNFLSVSLFVDAHPDASEYQWSRYDAIGGVADPDTIVTETSASPSYVMTLPNAQQSYLFRVRVVGAIGQRSPRSRMVIAHGKHQTLT